MKMHKTKVYVGNTACLKDARLFGELYQTVSPDRQRKIDAFLFEKDKRLSLAAELILQKGLSDAGISRYTLEYGAFGKPYIRGENVHFNLSHSGNMVMCAISDQEVGCDVEKVTDVELEIAKRFFFSTEYDAIAAAKSALARRELFFRYWTLKESFMKATGLGMRLALDAFRVDIDENGISLWQTFSRETYYLKEYQLDNGYKFASCGLNPDFADAVLVSFG